MECRRLWNTAALSRGACGLRIVVSEHRARAAKLCNKHAWIPRSKQRHVPDAKQVLLWKGWVLQQRLSDVQSRVGATATRAHVESPLRTELSMDSCSVRPQGNCCESNAKSPPLDLHPHTRHKQMFMRQDCCARTPQAHLDLSPCASKKTCSCNRLLRSHATSTLGSLAVRKQEDMFMQQTAAFSRHKHTCISLRAQINMFMRQHCCVLTSRAHLDLAPCARRPVHATTLLRSHAGSTHLYLTPCAKKHVPAKRLLRSHAASTLGSLSVRKQKDMFMRLTAAFARHKHTWISLRTQARRHFHATDCCVRTPQAHLDHSPCANEHVHATTLLRSHVASTLGSRSVRKETCSIEKTAVMSRCPPR